MMKLKLSFLAAVAMATMLAAGPAIAKNNLPKDDRKELQADKKALEQHQKDEREMAKGEDSAYKKGLMEHQKGEKKDFKTCEKNAKMGTSYTPGQCPTSAGTYSG